MSQGGKNERLQHTEGNSVDESGIWGRNLSKEGIEAYSEK